MRKNCPDCNTFCAEFVKKETETTKTVGGKEITYNKLSRNCIECGKEIIPPKLQEKNKFRVIQAVRREN